MIADSYWMDTTTASSFPALTKPAEADVVVIGAGIAGIATAWELSRTGRSVVLVEADRVAAGVTGYTTAKLTALHGQIYANLRKSFGTDGARLYAQSQQQAVEHVARTAHELDISCELERRPAVTYAELPEHAEDLQAEAEAAREAGLPATYLAISGLPYDIAGAVQVENQAQFHPRRYLLGLLDHLVEQGTRVYERTRVVDLDEGEPCQVRTEHGDTITAHDVVVATQYPVFDRALLFARLQPHRELVVAAPIPAKADPGGMYVTQEASTRSVRTAPLGDGRRLLIVTGEKFTPGTTSVSDRFDRLAKWTRERFGVSDIAYRWAAQDNATTDGVPYIGPFHPGARHTWVATGFGGWGMSNGILAGILLSQLISGHTPEWAGLYDPRRLHPLREAPALMSAQAKVAKHFIGDRLRPSHVDSPDEIPAGTGAVVRLDGQQCAVYRKKSGETVALSARCTHLGCIVAFNDAEQTWDCPCHGSRFAADGAVQQGPATTPLESADPA
jgi:glycine/D-amino acid oxidase-like deaminating enzyme/nitrite reductase/ring-hydroxylating ferredoxin subunit